MNKHSWRGVNPLVIPYYSYLSRGAIVIRLETKNIAIGDEQRRYWLRIGAKSSVMAYFSLPLPNGIIGVIDHSIGWCWKLAEPFLFQAERFVEKSCKDRWLLIV